ncbi:mfs transporter : Sugar phosphate permease OS=Singulisphaera acidiphila (strain ATCC BAA-1392 / DSM 18658 / VKM B-2454 / MOB10) GN=Sinac_6136 PE=4 SV=1: MFS_1 [Gemmataceae bacterium]|nr:mfs transporter : Sugar phosphate permease OS=Singulisphaera acidiphila (strain ATCC BAA-1392 / DSM 18658 / VKM B-2454 / MOB10) GN=Sinac_6136 PE=4 SV=1: MFS_1 [Gemmataceae bacterium]VTT98343.1 mfs transporter : Sugar phosphate permease OS=Singulisphaera acidiphila (strain ATCC BAA-1392 / DSM 18658 / VKM B-2454 / MOB10) GN=Sinac_6136 PE=4 SV=1: MFS_1 [Gemmataceae bacterium]
MTPLPTTQRATRVRYVVLFMLCILAMITYMDRAANGSAKKAIMSDLGVAEADFFWVLIAFQLAYAIFEIPSGWLGDTQGPRSTLLRVVLWWSVFVALTGFVGTSYLGGVYLGFTALVVIQFFFGVGEAGAFPNIAKSLYNWFPAADRGFAKSVIWMSARFMGGLTPLLWVVMTDERLGHLNWRQAMWIFAGVAFLWCVAFALFFTNRPRQHGWVNESERAEIDAGRHESHGPVRVPWGKLVRSRNLWAICFMYVVTNYCWYFLMYFLPGTMRKEFASWNDTVGGMLLLNLLAGCPLLIGMFGCLLGGTLSDRYIRRTGDRKWGRRLFGMIGYGGAGVCYFAAAGVKVADPNNLFLFAFFVILMGFMNDLIMAPAWAVCQDVGRDYAATVSGAMNMFGNLVGAVSTLLVTGLIMKKYQDDEPRGILICFTMYGCVYFLGVGLWLLIDPTKPIAEVDTPPVQDIDEPGVEEP